MNPQVAAKLMSDVPEMREFVDYIREQAAKLNDLSQLNETSFNDMPYEVRSRFLAHETLVAILTPLLNPHTVTPKDARDDYMV